ncbi:MAG TPA: allophanate hydrolase, partial [Polyangiaceae bacterium]|nr:allophanate hydrolase [Polyangiaceae bacterium]
QLATGLVGVRTPYGIPRNAFDERTIPGGSSSGSALAVARGHVSFALGTDTAGSGRVPAAFNNLVGLKPTRGLISTTGVVPACRSLDCVSIFALTVADACAVAEAAKGFDAFDPFSREDAGVVSFLPGAAPSSFRFGVPSERDLVFFDDEQARRNFHDAVERLERLGGERVAIDFAPFREAAALLYEGPWAAERLVAGKKILDENPEALHPVIRDILSDATRIDGLAAFRGTYRLRELARTTSRAWAAMDVLVVPTAPTIYSIADVESDPRRKNAHLGTYTNFVNLLDLSALAVPAGFRADGLPSGITLIGPRDHDHRLAAIGDAFHRSQSLPLGATGARDETAASPSPRNEAPSSPAALSLAVVGAHLRGLPLHHELLELGATFVRACRTVPAYRLFALPSATPPKPALVRVSIGETGHAIEVEVWSIPSANFGAFIAKVRAPLCIGTLALEDGTSVHGFLCEASATTNAEDISAHGGWRAYLASLKACSNPPLSV